MCGRERMPNSWKCILMIEDEAESINEVIIKREQAKKDGNEAEVESIEKMLKKKGFEIKDEGDIVSVSRYKKKDTL
jgi:cysteinyl-tRNA synthetase